MQTLADAQRIVRQADIVMRGNGAVVAGPLSPEATVDRQTWSGGVAERMREYLVHG